MSCDMNTPYAGAEGRLPQMKEKLTILNEIVFGCFIRSNSMLSYKYRYKHVFSQLKFYICKQQLLISIHVRARSARFRFYVKCMLLVFTEFWVFHIVSSDVVCCFVFCFVLFASFCSSIWICVFQNYYNFSRLR